MPVSLIRDYLQTQGLRLSEDEVRVGVLAAQTVMHNGRGEIDREVLWYAAGDAVLSEHIAPTAGHEALLKQIFMALDSAYSRTVAAQSAVVYALLPSGQSPFLLRLAQQGLALAQQMPVNEEYARFHLPVRSAQTGWLNLAEDVSHWLASGALEGSRNSRSQSQMSLPVCSQNGSVLGVVHVEYESKGALTEAVQADWVALALALAEPMAALLQPEYQEEQND
ncbi:MULTISPECIES: hypothetical protein [Neisseria]|uniref:GAF domain protein n=1 Tax=Neisseria musculi TaxID=1815583 RepID=A0A7H1MF32_9NEIS|nr:MULTISPECIES: hypothetical protein [Neisseria]MBF0803455.1 hypothetical protein [Neisseria sp. 19428wB4_WF04]QNT60247.1 hypothetical protein H7A79_0389 [Neisseria musculi]TFU43850.1 hypothetical protein E4T99_03640 [Neisseria sp. WF04]